MNVLLEDHRHYAENRFLVVLCEKDHAYFLSISPTHFIFILFLTRGFRNILDQQMIPPTIIISYQHAAYSPFFVCLNSLINAPWRYALLFYLCGEN